MANNPVTHEVQCCTKAVFNPADKRHLAQKTLATEVQEIKQEIKTDPILFMALDMVLCKQSVGKKWWRANWPGISNMIKDIND